MKIRPTHCATAAALILATGLGTTAAHAISVTPSAPCDTTLTDAGSNTWPIDPIFAFVIKGQDRITQVTAQEVGTGYWASFQNTGGIGCTAELDGRQITFPEVPTIIAGVVLSRKLYTPPTGSGAIRLLDTFRNTTDAPVTFVARTDRQSYYSVEFSHDHSDVERRHLSDRGRQLGRGLNPDRGHALGHLAREYGATSGRRDLRRLVGHPAAVDGHGPGELVDLAG